MSLTSSLNNAVSGLHVNQDALTILSRNVANKGTPGYHRQSLDVVDYNSQTSSYARSMGLNRTFNTSLQTYYTRQVSDASSASVQASYLDRLQGMLGKPGSAGSLDTLFGDLQKSMQALATSPNDYVARGEAVQGAKDMADTLNRLSDSIQGMRQETEAQIGADVKGLNDMLGSLQTVNARMMDLGQDPTAQASLMDQRDRLVSSVSELIDVQANYSPDGTVSLMTRSGVGLIDMGGIAKFNFESSGKLSSTAEVDIDPNKSKVGQLTLTTASGLKLDLVSQGVIQGGELDGLMTLRDKTLVEAQSQLDEIASGLAQAFSTVQTAGTIVPNGYSTTTNGIAPGNDMTIKVKVDGVEQTVKVVNTTKTGMDYRDASGTRVIGINMAAGDAAVVSQLQAAFDNPAKGPLDVTVGSSAAGTLQFTSTDPTTSVTGVTKRTTATGTQGEGSAMSLFVDKDNNAFTNDLDGIPPQKTGFAGRISINSAVLADNTLMVQSDPTTAMGDATRPNDLIDALDNLQFVSGGDPASDKGRYQLNGSLGDIIGQVVGFQGSNINAALTKSSDQQLTLDTVVQQMDGEYGVDVDDEMARLMQLQNSYSANAQVVSVVNDLINTLFNAV